MKARRRGQKGLFGAADLPVAKGYLAPRPRHLALLVGLGIVLALAAWALWDELSGNRNLSSSGPLSSAHSALEGNCEECHSQDKRVVEDAACTGCHGSSRRRSHTSC